MLRVLIVAFPTALHRPVMLLGLADCERATPGNIVILPSIMPAAKAAAF
ncbi:hypothetical protein [Nostoc sp.]